MWHMTISNYGSRRDDRTYITLIHKRVRRELFELLKNDEAA